MPLVEIPPSSHPLDTLPLSVHYTISTPTNANADRIDPSLPCVLFLHPLYFASEVFHPQFKYAPLRRSFNLIAMDMRIHGETQGHVWNGYTLENAAQGCLDFCAALDLPPVHIVGLSFGAAVALWAAIKGSPQQVASVAVMSTFTPKELPEVAAGRAEIAYVWKEGVKNDDMSAYNDAAFGSVQLFFGDQHDHLAGRVTRYYSMPQDLKQWHDMETCERIRILGVDTIVQRTVHSDEDLAKITVPVLLVHGENDFVYPPSTAIDLSKRLKDNGVEKVELLIAKDAPHFCSAIAWKEINPRLSSWLHSNLPPSNSPSAFTDSSPSRPKKFISPWQDGLYPPDDPASEEELEEEDEADLTVPKVYTRPYMVPL